MRKIIALFLIAAAGILMLAGCAKNAAANVVFTGTVEEVHETSLLVAATDGAGFDRASVSFSTDMAPPTFSFAVGQKVRVTILPQIAESYPVQVTAVAIELVAEPAPSGPAHPGYSASFFRADAKADGGFDYLISRARNAGTMVVSSVRHIPAILIDSADALCAFVEEAGAYYQLDVAYDGSESFAEAAAKYDDAFFAGNRLLILGTQESSGSIRHEIRDVAISGDALSAAVGAIVPEAGTDDMADWFIVLELAARDADACAHFDAYYQ